MAVTQGKGNIRFNNMQELQGYLMNPANYKAARKKQYTIWCCMPSIGTAVYNKLEDAKYTTNEKQRFVLLGTRGERWVIGFAKLVQTYTFGDGTPITTENLKAKMKDGVLDWFQVRTITNDNTLFATFIPAQYPFQLQTAWGSVLTGNRREISHGKGDFVLCSNMNGQPNVRDRWVVNGEVFADTYDNRGWTDYIKATQGEVVVPKPTDSIVKIVKADGMGSCKAIYTMLCQCKEMCAKELPFDVKLNTETQPNSIMVQAKVIADYKAKAAEDVNTKVTNFKGYMSIISFKDNKIAIKGYNVFQQSKKLAWEMEFADTPENVKKILSAPQIYAGLMGWIPNGMHNYWTYKRKPSKFMQDGIAEYTASSGQVNRKLRFQDVGDNANERGGMTSQIIYRAIEGCDGFLESSVLNTECFLFRGVSAGACAKFSTAGEGAAVSALSGATMANTAYTSTTLNLQSTLLFAKPRKEAYAYGDMHNGVILAIKAHRGLQSAYIHDFAGWGEQFEVLWDRCYDIKIGEKLLSFKGGPDFTYHIFMAEAVPHAAFEDIPSVMQPHKNIKKGKKYDENGRVRFDYEIVKGYMHEAYDVLRHRGLRTTVQIQAALKDVNGDERDYIVVRMESDDDYTTDLAFSYNLTTHLVDVVKFKSKNDNATGYDNAMSVKVRNTWNRTRDTEAYADQDFAWDDYQAGALQSKGEGMFEIIPKSAITLKIKAKPTTAENVGEVKLGEIIADTILEYVKYNKDVTLLPMQDTARYFDNIFKRTIINEGYWLKDSIPVVRVGNPDDVNDGYVPLKYHIDGDNDDSLVISMKLFRDEKGKLQLTYRGQSQSKKVNEQSTLRWNVFNQEIMEKTCNQILYVFVTKLNLNHLRKGDMLMNSVARYRYYKLTGTRYTEADDPALMRVEKKDAQRVYKMYFTPNPKDYIKVRLTSESRMIKADIQSPNGVNSIELDATQTINELYNQLATTIDNVRGVA